MRIFPTKVNLALWEESSKLGLRFIVIGSSIDRLEMEEQERDRENERNEQRKSLARVRCKR